MTGVRPELLDVLACPTCRAAVRDDGDGDGDELRCGGGHRWPVVDGVPVFTADGRDVARRPGEHRSNVAPDHLVELVASGGGPWLHLGAGATPVHDERSIELETALFAHTDVVGDAARLPFGDGTLSGALALNVFEHLEDPDAAAAELHRVLRPGGALVVQTAFLQPLHADPGHFFNVTELGLRRWFRAFAIEEVSIPGNFNPAYAFAWLASDLLWHAPPGLRSTFEAATVADLAAIWRDPDRRRGALYDAFLALPDGAQRVLAAGFELVARR